MIEEAVVALCQATPAIQNVVAGRIYDQVQPQDSAFPAIVYSVTERKKLRQLAGAISLRYARFEMDCRALDSATCRALGRAVGALNGPQTTTAGAATMQWVWHDDESDGYIAPQQQDERGLRRSLVNLIVWYQEDV